MRPKRFLVLCTANRCRSQMAHGWLAHLSGDRAEVFSAGTRPGGVHPLSIQVMAERGIDISAHTSDHLDAYASQPFDTVITVCDSVKEACPWFPGAAKTLHHSFDDPDDKTGTLTEEQMLPTFRRVRDEIAAWAVQFLSQQGVSR